MTLYEHALYGLLWLSFGLGHSLLAGEDEKSPLWPLFGRSYRLAYNLIATAHIAVVLAVGRLVLGAGLAPFERPDWLLVVQGAALLIGSIVVLAGLLQYDLGRFSGLAQLRVARGDREPPRDEAYEAPAPPEAATSVSPDTAREPLHLDGLHRYVRHPLYAGLYLVLWGLVRDEFSLATALWASLYLMIGTRFEERRLIARYGTAYEDYRRRVPALVPWPGRAQSRSSEQ